MGIWSSLGGMYVMQLTSAAPQQAMQALTNSGIVLSDPEMIDALTWQFCVSRTDGHIVMKMAKNRGENCRICGRKGIFWRFAQIRKRPILVLGLLGLCLLSCWIPNKVLFIHVEGNTALAQRLILQQAQDCGLYFGASTGQIRTQQVKDRLLNQIPQLQWAGVDIRGCVVTIRVKERISFVQEETQQGICSIISTADAIVQQIVVTSGTPLCQPGQAVKAGQTLISGYTDCGICIRADGAKGEIIGLTQRRISVIYPLERVVRTKVLSTEKKYSIIIGKKQINFCKDSGILGSSCAKIYAQKYMTLPGGFQLPISLVCEQWIYYDTAPIETTVSEDWLKAYAREYVRSNTVSGEFVYSQENLTDTNGCIKLEGIYGCLENIGMVRMEESLPDYGKSD